MGAKVTQEPSKGRELPAMNTHRPRKGTAIVALGTQMFIDLSFTEGENSIGHLHDIINNQPISPSADGFSLHQRKGDQVTKLF